MQNTGVQNSNQAGQAPSRVPQRLVVSFSDGADSRIISLIPQHFRIATAHLRQIIKLLGEHPNLHPNACSVSAGIARMIPLLDAMNPEANVRP
jgi:hypothetical protein